MSQPQLSPLLAEPFSSRFTLSLQRCTEEAILHYNEALDAMKNAPADEKLAYATIAAGHLNVLAHIMSK